VKNEMGVFSVEELKTNRFRILFFDKTTLIITYIDELCCGRAVSLEEFAAGIREFLIDKFKKDSFDFKDEKGEWHKPKQRPSEEQDN